MDKRELSQLYYLSKEIVMKREQLCKLQAIATGTAAQLTGLPGSTDKKDKVGKIAAEIADIKALLELKLQEYYYQYNRLTRYIEGIDDSLMRQIMTLRYVEMLSWNDVAARIGGGEYRRQRKASTQQIFEERLICEETCHECHELCAIIVSWGKE